MSTNQRQVKERPAGYSQRTAARMVGGLGNTACKERLRKLGVLSPNARTWRRNISTVFKSLKCTFREEETILISLSMVKITENIVAGLQQEGFSSDTWKNFQIVIPWHRLSRDWGSLQHQPSSTAGLMKSRQEQCCLGETYWRERGGADIFSGPYPGVWFCGISHGAAWGTKWHILWVWKGQDSSLLESSFSCKGVHFLAETEDTEARQLGQDMLLWTCVVYQDSGVGIELLPH